MFKKKTAEELGLSASSISCEKCKHNNQFYYIKNQMYLGTYCDSCYSPIVCNSIRNSVLSQVFVEGFKMENLDRVHSDFLKSIPNCPYCNKRNYSKFIYNIFKDPFKCFKCGNELDENSRKPILDLSDKQFYWYEEDR